MTTSAYPELLARLRQVKPVPSNKEGIAQAHKACCPAHEDRSPSLSLALTNDGRILANCFGGCAAADVLAACGFDFADAGPDRVAVATGAIKGAGSPASWGSFSAALNAVEDLVWQHLRGAPAAETADAALYAIAQLQRAGKAMMRAGGKGGRHV